jgi:DNA-binding MarR family transcriptional regulator
MSPKDTISVHYAQLDKLLEHRSRLAICSLLVKYEQISFRRFKELLAETDGNLGAQLRKLEDASYIVVSKDYEGRKPISWYAVTDVGRNALLTHIKALKGLTEL